jgi:hypothetical protein
MVAARQMIDSPRFRRRQILGWRFREEQEGFMLQPEYGDAASDFGARFEGTIEQAGSGSCIGGMVILSRTMRVTMSVWFLFVVEQRVHQQCAESHDTEPAEQITDARIERAAAGNRQRCDHDATPIEFRKKRRGADPSRRSG